MNILNKIVGIQKTSLIDYPNLISTVLFLSGCNLRCPYCHNPNVVLDEYEVIPYDEIRNLIVERKEKNIIEGVVISGGEPTIHYELIELCDDLKSLGVKIKIDTNGLEPNIINACDPDYLALDIKTSFEKYPMLSQQLYHDYRERLRASIDIAKQMGNNAEVRITAAPRIITHDDIDELCIELCGIKKLFIQQFAQTDNLLDPSYSKIKPYPTTELEEWQEKFLSAGIEAMVRGR